MQQSIHSAPLALKNIIAGEDVDFFIKSKRDQPAKPFYFLLMFGFIWFAFTSIFIAAFFGPLFFGNEINFTSNGQPVTASFDNYEPLIFPAIVNGLFVLLGLAFIGSGIASLLKKGSYYVGTEKRLLKYKNGEYSSYNWDQFTGNIHVHTKSTNGSLQLELRTGSMRSRKNKPSQYVPHTLYISGILNATKIEHKCSLRIKENDPMLAMVV
ncbi:hypothetical protein H0I23_03205 [Cellulophaga sp. HaHaR_3_176]|uniref:hypothetical protein n=1 Tax=Cellulophaga sp. HaHaR_3_176 TaxID=1942464 RepID=UPI001C1FC968|nr:hypothetical protein [Cellulophaga sp. HaHaR_3_176]QWX84669.1 hypothetical protein H0I23_03205 [Cellulophaga sp. HaHaR_3_176]